MRRLQNSMELCPFGVNSARCRYHSFWNRKGSGLQLALLEKQLSQCRRIFKQQTMASAFDHVEAAFHILPLEPLFDSQKLMIQGSKGPLDGGAMVVNSVPSEAMVEQGPVFQSVSQ